MRGMDLSKWQGARRPGRVTMDGRYAGLEPLDPQCHGPDLLAASQAPGAGDRFRYLFEDPPRDLADLQGWMARATAGDDPLFFAVIDRATGRAAGRQALMRIEPAHGVIEIGNILWNPAIAGTRVATEALYLAAAHVFDDLGYRRFEWKCHDLNAPSKRAALRFGFTFEGVFRQHMVHKGANRDTAWFAMLDRDWPVLKARYQAWLAPANFDDQGRQRRRLQDCG
jgi:RimJ/RimL family protein N-acetyltransferase